MGIQSYTKTPINNPHGTGTKREITGDNGGVAASGRVTLNNGNQVAAVGAVTPDGDAAIVVGGKNANGAKGAAVVTFDSDTQTINLTAAGYDQFGAYKDFEGSKTLGNRQV